MENISPPPLNKVSWGHLSKEQPILGHCKLLIYQYLKILIHICISFLTLLMYVYMCDLWSRQTILNPCCIETTFLSVCITPASTCFLWSALPLNKTCGISLDGCVGLLFHIGQLMIPVYQDFATSIKNTCICPWIACSQESTHLCGIKRMWPTGSTGLRRNTRCANLKRDALRWTEEPCVY